MIKFLLSAIAYYLLVFMSGCGPQKQDMQIKDLDAGSIDFKHADTTTTSRQQAIDNYKYYINKSALKENHSVALKRLADLELQHSETIRADDEEKTSTAKSLTLSSIKNYTAYLKNYPNHKDNDKILYQLAKAYSYTGDTQAELNTLSRIVKRHPNSKHIDEVQFRRGELYFSTNKYRQAETAFESIVKRDNHSIFYQKSLYKLGWSQFKQSKYLSSLASYFLIMDNMQSQGKITASSTYRYLNRGEEDFINDTLRAINLALSYEHGEKTIRHLFAQSTDRNYEALIYKSLAKFYLQKGRHADAAHVFLAYGQTNPDKPLAAIYTSSAIKAYASGNLQGLVLSTKEHFAKKYGTNTSFWSSLNTKNKDIIKKHLALHIKDLTSHWHALAHKTRKSKDIDKAVYWYNSYLDSFPNDASTASMNFLLADLLFDLGKYNAALKEYIKTGYDYPVHNKNSEAAYAAILTYNKLVDSAEAKDKAAFNISAIKNSIRFSNTYPDDRNAPVVITKTAENLFNIKNYKMAAEFARRITYRKELQEKRLAKTAWTVYAHSLFELGDYIGAEHTYQEVLKRTKARSEQHTAISEKLAASIYKQGENKRDKGRLELAAYHFTRLGQIVPKSPIRETAEYDAATMYIQLKQWDKAIAVLNDYKLHFPQQEKFAYGVAEKLALAYTKSGLFAQAADQLSLLASMADSTKDKRLLSWQSAEMYTQADEHQKANSAYVNYIKHYPEPFSQYIEAHRLVSDYYLNNKQDQQWYSWLRKTVKVEARANKQRTSRSNLIAAQAVMHLATPLVNKFKQAELTIPLKKSLKTKKRLMERALKTYADALDYKIAEITTESTYNVAEIYRHFALALMQSQRPNDLNEEELEQYDILLEEQAYPFEEKTIDIHSSNIKRTQQGIYDKWVKLSFNVLAKMQPVRYSKQEKIEDYVSAAH